MLSNVGNDKIIFFESLLNCKDSELDPDLDLELRTGTGYGRKFNYGSYPPDPAPRPGSGTATLLHTIHNILGSFFVLFYILKTDNIVLNCVRLSVSFWLFDVVHRLSFIFVASCSGVALSGFYIMF